MSRSPSRRLLRAHTVALSEGKIASKFEQYVCRLRIGKEGFEYLDEKRGRARCGWFGLG